MISAMVPRTSRLTRPLIRFEREMENLMDRLLGADEDWWKLPEGFSPRCNVAETETNFEVTVELPGMKPEEFNVELRNGELWISGERKEEKEEKGKTYHRIERRYGEFRRVFPLGTAVEESKIEAAYKEGVLRVVVPKAEAVKPKHIEVKT